LSRHLAAFAARRRHKARRHEAGNRPAGDFPKKCCTSYRNGVEAEKTRAAAESQNTYEQSFHPGTKNRVPHHQAPGYRVAGITRKRDNPKSMILLTIVKTDAG